MGCPCKPPAHLPRELRPLAAVDEDVIRRIDGTVQLRLAAPEAPPVTCEGAGCASCCELLTMGALTEGIRIAQNLIARPGVRARFEEDLPAHLAVYERLGVDRVRYWNERHRCIFLTGGAEPRCKVYEARPIACRTHLSIDPPAACETRGPEARRRLVDLTEIELAATAHFVEAELSLGLPILGGPVPVIALWGLALVEHGVAGWRRRFGALPETDPRAPAFWLRRLAELPVDGGLRRERIATGDGEEHGLHGPLTPRGGS